MIRCARVTFLKYMNNINGVTKDTRYAGSQPYIPCLSLTYGDARIPVTIVSTPSNLIIYL